MAQVVRIHCHTQEVRQGKVIKETDDTRFAVTSYWSEEADPNRLLELGRGHWSIENGQYYRRDRTQDEDRCPVRDTTAARNLSLFRSLACCFGKHAEGVKTPRAPDRGARVPIRPGWVRSGGLRSAGIEGRERLLVIPG